MKLTVVVVIASVVLAGSSSARGRSRGETQQRKLMMMMKKMTKDSSKTSKGSGKKMMMMVKPSPKPSEKKYKKMYEDLLVKYDALQVVVDNLREISKGAQLQLARSPPLTEPQVTATCTEFCNQRAFAAGCETALDTPQVFNGFGRDVCLASAPMGLGLLVYDGGLCCRNDASSPCLLVGTGADNGCQPCSKYPPKSTWAPTEDLFPLLDRTYDETTGVCSNN